MTSIVFLQKDRRQDDQGTGNLNRTIGPNVISGRHGFATPAVGGANHGLLSGLQTERSF
jgi:hypothetical protein